MHLFVHISYLPNLASPQHSLYLKSIKALVKTMKRAETLDAEGLVIHLGNHLKSKEEEAKRLRLIHLNDSKTPLASSKDRHEHIGKGYIRLSGFYNIVNHPQLINLPDRPESTYFVKSPWLYRLKSVKR